MKKIKLTKNQFAIVDDEDFDGLNKIAWYFSDNGYAISRKYVYFGYKKYGNETLRMHRLVNNTPKGLFTDHINGNKLDNRKENLRTTNKSLNGINRSKQNNNSSGYKGVHLHKHSNKWMAELQVKSKKIYLGLYANIEEAVKARKVAEKKYHAI